MWLLLRHGPILRLRLGAILLLRHGMRLLLGCRPVLRLRLRAILLLRHGMRLLLGRRAHVVLTGIAGAHLRLHLLRRHRSCLRLRGLDVRRWTSHLHRWLIRLRRARLLHLRIVLACHHAALDLAGQVRELLDNLI